MAVWAMMKLGTISSLLVDLAVQGMLTIHLVIPLSSSVAKAEIIQGNLKAISLLKLCEILSPNFI